MSEKCFTGWSEESGNKSGACCCNCRYQYNIVAHPWNKREYTRGSIAKTIGWGCKPPEMEDIVMFDFKHSMCEMHQFKDNVVQLRIAK
jgi:hypothetical protein